ncbi:ferritin-like domain-containing protein [Krasilnikovia sp. MM14-A1259]|uniref:ferritin-like domain-containing protein n=1 Tax=Krasilnikovia sp. MM14-A1259 TaxID=3373539 RepID=UPI0038129007
MPGPQGVTPTQFRDLSWIRGAMQTAIALEHSTMPLYSAAMYSLEVQNYPSYNSIRSVLMEEMLHMAAACNILAALGGRPGIADLEPRFPRAGLPGQVAPDLRVVLAPLSVRQLKTFMRIEAPEFLLAKRELATAYPTIGRFYQAIKDAVAKNATAVRAAVRDGGPANQVGGNLGYRTIVPRDGVDPVDEILEALDMIMEQGEGEPARGIGTSSTFQNEESHYGRFAELRYGARYQQVSEPVAVTAETEEQFFRGEPIAWPVVINTLAVPSDHYGAVLSEDPNAPAVEKELDAFDAAYTAMMTALHQAWNGPVERSWPSLGEAVVQMNEMRVLSCFNILRHQVPPAAVARLAELYPAEYRLLAEFTDLDRPVFYGPRFVNQAAR